MDDYLKWKNRYRKKKSCFHFMLEKSNLIFNLTILLIHHVMSHTRLNDYTYRFAKLKPMSLIFRHAKPSHFSFQNNVYLPV